MVTLHTSVVYYPDESHKSYVAISDEMGHNASTVHAILKKLITLLKNENKNLNLIHYLTDSPTSQYRNKTIFQLISHHYEEFGLSARWDYLEAGHGKGPCDGLGAAVKRAADYCVSRGKQVIQSPHDFFAWTQSKDNNSETNYFFVSKDDVGKSVAEIDNKKSGLLPVAGTFNLHAVYSQEKDVVWTRNMSCYCDECYKDPTTTSCDGWKKHFLKREIIQLPACPSIATPCVPPMVVPVPEKGDNNVNDNLRNDEPLFDINVGDWVAAEYECKGYIGVVLKLDEGDCLVNFLEKSGKMEGVYKWPLKKDEIWCKKNKLFWKLSGPPNAVGKSKRTFALSQDDMININAAFDAFSNE